MNLLDIFVILIVVAAIIGGFQRGFLLGVYELIMLAAGLLVASAVYPVLARLFGRFLDVQPVILNILGFIAAVLIFQLIASLTLGNVVRFCRRKLGYVPGVSMADRIAGIFPGTVHGLLIATLVLIPIAFFAVPQPIKNQFNESRFALSFYRDSSDFLLRAVTVAGLDLDDFVAVTPRQTGSGFILPFQVVDGLTANESAEMRMFDLVNEERAAAGLPPLIWDPELVPVARDHSREMFELGYFSHDSPVTGSPFDRLRNAGVTYATAGENLALAPTVDIAHQGLMDSPGHRANILHPAYGRMGIGAISSPGRGTMFTQLFRD